MKPDAGLPVAPERVAGPAPRDEVGTDALRAHHARYTWPIGDAHADAQVSLDVETRTASDGR
ncbi:MAG: hypothetical protein ACN6QT_26995, partial [Burkholderia contaminans]